MDIALGRTGIVLGLIACLLGILSLWFGVHKNSLTAVKQGRYLLIVSVIGIVLATFAMEHALITHDFALSYVVANNSRETPLLFSVTGMWSALQGSMLLWALVLGGYLVAMVAVTRKYSDRPTASVALIIAGIVLLFFLVMLDGPTSPFTATVGRLPLDGQGPNPLLQQYPLVAVHPPFLYLGFVGMTVPFAFSSAALITSDKEKFWLSRTRSWTLVAWIALTIGITLGAWWSYQVLGWGGFWAWDPVENSAFLPWLCATAFLHSSIAQQRRSSLKVWNYALVASAFALTILGTYFTRSGVLQSVHAFSDSTLGSYLIIFFGVVVVFAVTLVVMRAEDLRGDGAFRVGLSRNTAILINNILFAGFAFVILLGTSFPLLIQALNTSSVTVGTPYFNSFAIPIGLFLLFFMAIAPVLPWRHTSITHLADEILLPALMAALVIAACAVGGESHLYVIATFALATFAGVSAGRRIFLNVTRRKGTSIPRRVLSRANGGMLTHIGVVVIAVALVSTTAFGHQGEIRLRPGQSTTFFGQSITYLGVQNVITPSKSSFEANILVDGAGPYHPSISQYGSYTQTVGMPAVNVRLTRDVYVTIDAAPNLKIPDSRILLGVIVQPLISWLWAGALIMALGALLAAFGAGGVRDSVPRSIQSRTETDTDAPADDDRIEEVVGSGSKAVRTE